MPQTKIILALDQSSKISGWSVFKENKLIEFGHWTHTSSDIALRIHSLCQEVKSKIQKHGVNFVVIENIQLEKNTLNNVSTFQKLAWVQGALMETLQSLNIDFTFLYPNEWRQSCGFLKGNDKSRSEQKKIAQQWVLKNYNQKCTEDEADAICIGHGYLNENYKDIEFE